MFLTAASISKDITIEEQQNVTEGMVNLIGQKRVMSEEHRIYFIHSTAGQWEYQLTHSKFLTASKMSRAYTHKCRDEN